MGTDDRETDMERWVRPFSRAMNRIASVVLFFMMFLTVCDVVGRKLFSHSITGSVELTEFMLVIVVFFSLAHTELKDAHVKVDLITSRLGEVLRIAVEIVIQLIGFLFCALITWSSLLYTKQMWASREVSQDLWLPKYPFVFLVALGCGVLALALLVKFIIALSRVCKS